MLYPIRNTITAALIFSLGGTGLAYKTSVYYTHHLTTGEDVETRHRTKISDTFTDEKQQKLKRAFQIVLNEVEEHFKRENDFDRDSKFRRCVKKYATKDFARVDDNESTTKDRAISAVMTGMVVQIGSHRSTDDRSRINYLYEPPDTNGFLTMGSAVLNTSYWNDGVKMRINMNSYALGIKSTRKIAGTIFHEMMHRLGWDHPSGYAGSFIKEAGLCISRNNRDKPDGFSLTGDPDYKLLD